MRFCIFDIDGTLVDSREAIASAMDEAFNAIGLEGPGYERTRHVVGLSLTPACKFLAPPDLSDADVERLVEAYKNAFLARRARCDTPEPLYDGALDLLRSLSEDGWLIGAATGKARRGVDYIFDRHDIGRYFDTVWCADDGPGKPHPFMVDEAVRAVGAARDRSLMVGDTSHDIVMARAAGVRAIGVTWGFHLHRELVASGAHEIHDDFASLRSSLDGFLALPA